ncbi:MAG TPA: TIGR00159 family protein [Flavobacteriales bacterium]|jgi:diadenylate cyclase|nr:TIGR00159 family protein [Flavobacteriales bacterium]
MIDFIEIRWLDVLDIFIVAAIVTYIFTLIRGTVTLRIVFGLVLIVVFWQLTRALQMELTSNLIGAFLSVGAIAFVIIFQPELRRFLIRLGSGRFASLAPQLKGIFNLRGEQSTSLQGRELSLAIQRLSNSKTGALIVIDYSDDIGEIVSTGVRINALLSAEIIETIFQKNAPLHDGAIIINGEKVLAASCVLPNSENDQLPQSFGMRHRAAIGMSEHSQSKVIMVSEETGKVLLCMNSQYEIVERTERIQEFIEK